MPLSHEAAAIIRGAVLDAMTRELTADEVFAEVLRLVRQADTPQKLDAIGRVIGEISWLAKTVREAAARPHEPPTDETPGPVATGAAAQESQAGEGVA